MAGHFGPIEAKPGDPVVILSCEKTVMVNGKLPGRSGYDQRSWQIERFSRPRLIYEFQHDRGKKVRHSVCRNDSGCAKAHRPNKPNMAKGFFVDRAIEDAAFILERIEAHGPRLLIHFC